MTFTPNAQFPSSFALALLSKKEPIARMPNFRKKNHNFSTSIWDLKTFITFNIYILNKDFFIFALGE